MTKLIFLFLISMNIFSTAEKYTDLKRVLDFIQHNQIHNRYEISRNKDHTYSITGIQINSITDEPYCEIILSTGANVLSNMGVNNKYATSLSVKGANNIAVGNSFFAQSNLNFAQLISVLSIGNDALLHSAKLDKLYGNSLIIAKDKFVSGCSNLKTVHLPRLMKIGSQCFENCISIKTLSLPELTTVGAYFAFRCSALQSFLASKLTTASDGFLQECSSIKTLSLPELTTVGAGFLSRCSELEVLSLPKLETVDANFLKDCTSLKLLDIRSFVMKDQDEESLKLIQGLEKLSENSLNIIIKGYDNGFILRYLLGCKSVQKLYVILNEADLAKSNPDYDGKMIYISQAQADKIVSDMMKK